jgi:hypothetical protein
MPEIVEPANRVDARGFLGWPPLVWAEVVDVELAASLSGKEERRPVAVDPVERVECPRL